MIVVSDTSPLSALAEIGLLDLLPQLFGVIVVPAPVLSECLHAGAPATLRSWAAVPPGWVKITPAPAVLPPEVAGLDPGESAAIAVAASGGPRVLLVMDERQGVAAAARLGLPVVGTLGLLVRGHARGLLDFDSAVAALLQTGFWVSPAVIARARQRLGK